VQKLIVVYREPLYCSAEEALARLAALPETPACGITAHLRTAAIPAELRATGGFDAAIGAALALWVNSFEDLDAIAAPLAAIGAPGGIYAVVESTPREYASIDWADGARSPGITLLALMRRRAGLGTEEFMRLWHEHSAMSLRIHPLTRYHRNAVLCRIRGDGEHWDGIVEERVGSVEDLAHDRFYTGAGARERAIAHLASFVDVLHGGMQCALLEEYIVRRPAWLRARP